MPPRLGIHLTVWAGQGKPAPLPPGLFERLRSAEVTEDAAGRSGFQLAFDSDPKSKDQLRPFDRVVVIAYYNASPHVLMDGFVTHLESQPGSLTATGSDVSLMMDLKARIVEHKGQSEPVIAAKILKSYARYGVVPRVVPPPAVAQPLPTRRIPVQHGTDREYLDEMAARFGYVFYVQPGPAPLASVGYWGPPPWIGMPQPALSLALGPSTNVESLRFDYDSLAPATVTGRIQEPERSRALSVRTVASTLPPLARDAAIRKQRPNVRESLLEKTGGLTYSQARAKAQGDTNVSTGNVLVATGELDAAVYGGVLRAHALVGVRGAGLPFDGNYFARRVTHKLLPRQGDYRQGFELVRDGFGALVPGVRP